MYLARILGPEGQTLVDNWAIPSKMAYIAVDFFRDRLLRELWLNESISAEVALDYTTINAKLERELPPEDGGPLLIYRVSAKDAVNS